MTLSLAFTAEEAKKPMEKKSLRDRLQPLLLLPRPIAGQG
jgi:hypothetical protein